MPYISEQGLDNLKHYKYSGEDKSILANLFLKKHWDWCCRTLFPIWMAPNMITLTGFFFLLGNCLTILYFCPNVNGTCPPWVYFYAALGVYLYQIFDNVDGRQARRTGTSSPLGELFDHGCDSLFVVMASILLSNGGGMTGWEAFFIFCAIALPFIMAHWEEFYTGKLILGMVGNPTEGQLVMTSFLIMTGLYGQSLWSGPVQVGSAVEQLLGANLPPSLVGVLPAEAPLNRVLLATLFVAGIVMSIYNTMAVLRIVYLQKKSLLKAISMLLPMTIAVGSCSAWFHLSKEQLMITHTTACLFFLGVMFSYILNRILIARIMREEYNIWNPVHLLPLLGLSIQLLLLRFPHLLPAQLPLQGASEVKVEVVVLYSLLSLLLAVYLHFVLSVISQLCAHLQISCLTIPYPPPSQTGQPFGKVRAAIKQE
ncbi:Cholinephosphotransferase 1 [Balamuthia mandrillaris]